MSNNNSNQNEIEPEVDPRTVYFILENASLQYAKIENKLQLLSNNPFHEKYITKKLKKDPNDFNPHILFDSLKTLLDSPLNKAGLLKVYIHTYNDLYIDVNSDIRLPRTYPRFAGLIVQLLLKKKIVTEDGKTLMRILKKPILSKLPSNSIKISTSFHAENVHNINQYVLTLPERSPQVFIVGVMPTGRIDLDFVDTEIAISNYPLSAQSVCAKITNAIEEKYLIV
eukprot:TRINITY_DN2633_c0_g1_i1.p1 TRINITY_DN2633_c0_g1~~TRINITY_DN2633_c0_g1_i1.p1  ORF type:complete len:226 (+),score=64.34 TRINITY_DN2633_c0_g1_i1:805-1482(+)